VLLSVISCLLYLYRYFGYGGLGLGSLMFLLGMQILTLFKILGGVLSPLILNIFLLNLILCCFFFIRIIKSFQNKKYEEHLLLHPKFLNFFNLIFGREIAILATILIPSLGIFTFSTGIIKTFFLLQNLILILLIGMFAFAALIT
jgi:hypothetical protein